MGGCKHIKRNTEYYFTGTFKNSDGNGTLLIKFIAKHTDEKIKQIERFSFYERAKKAYAVIMTGETALYGCIIFKKGVIK